MSAASEEKLSTKQTLFVFYILIAIGVTIWGWLWGPFAYKGFLFNFGLGAIWPLYLLIAIGRLIAIVICIILILGIVASAMNDRE